jgi:solute carrier family 35 protein E1
MFGVGLATVKELSFAWAALLGAVLSDLALALRNVFSKQSMGSLQTVEGEALKPADMFGLLTCISAIVSIPMAMLAEGRALPALWATAAAADPGGGLGLAAKVGATGLYFYGYSEVAMKALNNVHPVTHAIGNTMRRVVIMLVCMVAFRTPMTPLGAVGSALAIGGSYLYAMTKQQEKALERAAAEAQAAEEERDDELTERLVDDIDGAEVKMPVVPLPEVDSLLPPKSPVDTPIAKAD